jgi:uncharacterized protein (TIGR03437 family)
MHQVRSNIVTVILCCLLTGGLAQAQMQQGDGIWVRNAYYGEAQTFDKCLGHQPGNGQYHHHAHPICLRAQLDDNLGTLSTGRTGTSYREKPAPWKHSPLLGWALDGYPIYGPYGYADAMNPNSAIKRMKSSFGLRELTQRTALPSWALAHHPNLTQTTLAANQYGPDVSDTFPLGRYVEDYDYVPGSGDLDQYNGRNCVTPEFPNGTYAYFVTLDDNGAPAFPYIIGMQYYGNVTGSNNATAPANAQGYFSNGAYTQTVQNVPQLNAWLTRNSQQEAQVVSGFDPSAGPKTTWPLDVPAGARTSGGAATPAKADPQTISFTEAAVYVASNNLASYVMGPWFIDGGNGGVFQNFPSAQNFRVQIPRTPSAATTKRSTGLGAVGIWVNGVAVFNVLDGASYSNAQRTDVGGGGVRLSSMHVSAASFEGGPTAPGALMTAFPLFGAKLATATATADTPAWPSTLAGSVVTIRDAANVTHTATLAYASPTQLNYRVPESVATGLATVTIAAGGVSIPGALNIGSAYPNLFQLGEENVAAGYLIRVRNGQQSYEPLYAVNSAGAVTALPIDLGSALDQVYLILFGTGLGKATQVSASIGGVSVTPAYAGPQGVYAGLDQFNLLLPHTLAGKGKVSVTVSAEGRASNQVVLSIK